MKKKFTRKELIRSGINQIRKYLKRAYIISDDISYFKERALAVSVTLYNLGIIERDKSRVLCLIIHREIANIRKGGCAISQRE